MISSGPCTEYRNLALQLGPVTVKPFSHPCRQKCFLLPQNYQIILCSCLQGPYPTLRDVLVAFCCEAGDLGTISDSLLYSWPFVALSFVNSSRIINLHPMWCAGAVLSHSLELIMSSWWWLVVGRGRSVYTLHVDKCHKPGLPPPRKPVIKHLPAHNSLCDFSKVSQGNRS